MAFPLIIWTCGCGYHCVSTYRSCCFSCLYCSPKLGSSLDVTPFVLDCLAFSHGKVRHRAHVLPHAWTALLRVSGDTRLEAAVCGAEALTAACCFSGRTGLGTVVSADVPSSNINLRHFHLNVHLLLILPILVFKDTEHFILQRLFRMTTVIVLGYIPLGICCQTMVLK